MVALRELEHGAHMGGLAVVKTPAVAVEALVGVQQ